MSKNEISKQTSNQKSLSLANFKSLYYQLNAKPDTAIKIFKESRTVELSDIVYLNDKIEEKLRNHEIVGSIVSIKISLSDNRILDFSLWEEFITTKWDFPSLVKSIELQWDFNVLIPKYKNPQRHTLKLRIGSELKPNEMFQLVFNNDSDIESDQLRARVVCKVDYINYIISNELINIVAEWYDSLPLVKEQTKIVDFLTNNQSKISGAVNLLFSLTGILIGLLILKILIGVYNSSFSENILLNIAISISVLWASVYILGYVGEIVAQHISRRLNNLDDISLFLITRGDKNKNKERHLKNRGIIKRVAMEIAGNIIVNIVLLVVNILFGN